MVRDFLDEFSRYRQIAEKAFSQLEDADLNRIPTREGNSIAMIVRHLAGNLLSRFTDFLTTDGEKPWRDREAEFAEREYTRDEMMEWWVKGWNAVEREVGVLGDADLEKKITIRGQDFTVHEALARLTAHAAYHVGQIVLLARMSKETNWQWISIPRGKSDEYNVNPTMEKAPR